MSNLGEILLTWTLILSIPAIIVCVTIGIACSGLPKVKESHEKQKSKLLFWLYFYLIIYWIAAVFGILSDTIFWTEFVNAGEMTETEITEITDFYLFLTLITTIISWVGLYYLIVCLWSQIPKNIARITPRNAARFSLIPFFNFYGWFVTFHGLLKDMNKTAQRYGQPLFVTLEFAVGICIFWIEAIVVTLFVHLFVPQDVFTTILLSIFSLVNLILTTAFFIYLYNNVVKLIAMEPLVSQESITMSDNCLPHSNQKTLKKAIAKVTFRFWVWFISSLAILPAFIFMFVVALSSQSDDVVMGGCFLLFVSVALSGIFGLLFLYTVWEQIPPHIARTTPAKAILFLFIPFFAIYWQFVAIYGLGKDLNQALEQIDSPLQVNQTAGLLTCIACIASCIPVIGTVIAIIGVIIGAVYMFSLQNGIVELLTLQRENDERLSNQRQRENQINDDKQNSVMF